MFYAWIYRLYLDWMPRLGRVGRHGAAAPAVQDLPPIPQDVAAAQTAQRLAFETMDASATSKGKAYRGVGVVVGLLGILIVAAAVAPTALEVENHQALIAIGGLKVGMMLTMLYLVYKKGYKSDLKSQWIEHRRQAETHRYARLHDFRKALTEQPSAALARCVYWELRYILDDKDSGQIAYNSGKAEKYQAIEHASERLSRIGFGVALLCACLLFLSEIGWMHHHAALIFGTAAVPAFVGGIHGINGFLNIGGLAEEHAKMANFLRGIHGDLTTTPADNVEGMLLLVERAYGQLVDRDVQWAESTAKVNLNLA
jgi:hypothetical protein